VQVNFSKKLTSETVYFPYLPLNHTATIQHVLEHAKVEYRIGHRWKVGVGYALYKFGNEPRQDKPFVTVTRETERWGAVELWPYQKIPTGAQMQLRYSLSHKHSS
jgi:hypothetical protein